MWLPAPLWTHCTLPLVLSTVFAFTLQLIPKYPNNQDEFFFYLFLSLFAFSNLYLPVDLQSESPSVCTAERSHAWVWSSVQRLWCFLAVLPLPTPSLSLLQLSEAHLSYGGSNSGCPGWKLPHVLWGNPSRDLSERQRESDTRRRGGRSGRRMGQSGCMRHMRSLAAEMSVTGHLFIYLFINYLAYSKKK